MLTSIGIVLPRAIETWRAAVDPLRVAAQNAIQDTFDHVARTGRLNADDRTLLEGRVTSALASRRAPKLLVARAL